MADIPIAAVHRRVQYTSSGSTGPYSFSFAILDEGDLAVYDASTLKTISTHYTVTIAANGTGSITFGVAPTSGNLVTIISDQAVERTSDFTTSGDYRAATINTELDRITIIQQQLESLVRRTPQIDVFSNRDVSDSGAGPLNFPYGSTAAAVTAQADAFIKFDALGTSLETSATGAAQSLAGDGTVLLPYYSYSSDPNSGQFRVGADQLGWSVNGVKGLDLSTTGLTVTGTLDVGGDTSAGDNAAMGYTSAEGLILTGQGSTNDVTVKNDADAIALEVPTGTQNVNVLGNLVLTGNLTVNGTTVTNNVTNQVISDPLIELNSGLSGSDNANDLGFIFERGDLTNAFLGWDESGDHFVAGTTTATGSSTGNISYSYAPFKCSAITATSGTLAGLTSIAMSAGATLTAGFLDEDDMASDSAVAGVTQQSAKAYVDSSSKAAGISMTWETTTTDTDQGVGKVWANNATLSSATVLYFDDVERNSVSINALIDSLDDPTASNSATIYIQEAGSATAGVMFKVSGAVTSASTYSKVAVTHQATFGTLSDGDVVGVTFAFSGDDGAGSGDLVASNNLSDVASAATSFGNIKQAASTTATGVSELATTAETVTGTDTARVVTPAGLHAALAGLTDATITASDTVIFADVGSSNALKEDTVQGILDLVPSSAGKNLLINGDMRIAQRGTSFAAATNEYTLDRWKYYLTGAGAVTITQDTDVPNKTFGFSLKVDVTTADSSLASGDRYRLQYVVEGFDAAQLSFGTSDAKTITVSFWVKSPKTGQHSIFLANSAFDRFYPAIYTVSSADTWENKTITIPGDTTGTWVGATNGIGLYLAVILAVGSTYHGTVDAWNAGQAYGNSSNINIMDNTANNFLITGVQLEVGSAATDFEHRGDYASELARCQRYYCRFTPGTAYGFYPFGTGVASTTSRVIMNPAFPVWMRAAPSQSDSGAFFAYDGGNVAVTGISVNQMTAISAQLYVDSSTGFTQYRPYLLYNNNDAAAYVAFDAEL
jgi:hypothetical protein